MSGYQYYEFQAVDRPLTDREQAELRALSTRAEISAYRFSNVYHWGNFKGSPDQLMEQYFDAHVYVTNWGTRLLMLRLPLRLFEPERAAPYLPDTSDDGLSLWTKGDKVILRFEADDEVPDLVDGSRWLTSLLPLRAELLSGDLRGLYLGWLACAWAGGLSKEDEEPPVPPGLCSLSPALLALAHFLLIPSHLIAAAAQASPEVPVRASLEELERWVRALHAAEKETLLLRLMGNAEPYLGLELRQRFEAERQRSAPQAPPARRRTVGELLRTAEAIQEEQQRREAERRATARAKELDALAAREPAAWEQVEQYFATRSASDHAAGVKLLVDLREVARRRGTEAEFTRALSRIREQNAHRAGLMSRMDKEGLSAEGLSAH
jgi:hypothetical protein